MNLFIMPVTSQQIGKRTANGPKYLATHMSGLTLKCIPYGAEGWGIVGLQSVNPALSAEEDVYTFPADLTTVMDDADVSTLTAFLTAANVPANQIVSGMRFAEALQNIAKIFLVAQTIASQTGSQIFTDGITFESAVSDTTVATASSQKSIGKGIQQSGQQQAATGPFDFSGVAADDTIGDTLTTISQQFSDTVIL